MWYQCKKKNNKVNGEQESCYLMNILRDRDHIFACRDQVREPGPNGKFVTLEGEKDSIIRRSSGKKNNYARYYVSRLCDYKVSQDIKQIILGYFFLERKAFSVASAVFVQ